MNNLGYGYRPVHPDELWCNLWEIPHSTSFYSE